MKLCFFFILLSFSLISLGDTLEDTLLEEYKILTRLIRSEKNQKNEARRITVLGELIRLYNRQLASVSVNKAPEITSKIQKAVKSFRYYNQKYIKTYKMSDEIDLLFLAGLTEFELSAKSKWAKYFTDNLTKTDYLNHPLAYEMTTFISDYYFKNQEYGKSIIYYEQIKKYFPTRIDSRQKMNLLWSYFKNDRFSEAYDLCRLYIKNKEVDTQIYTNDIYKIIVFSSLYTNRENEALIYLFQSKDFVKLELIDLFEFLDKKERIENFNKLKLDIKNKLDNESYLRFLVSYWSFMLKTKKYDLERFSIRSDFNFILKNINKIDTNLISQLVSYINERIELNKKFNNTKRQMNPIFYYSYLSRFDEKNKISYYLNIAKLKQESNVRSSFLYLNYLIQREKNEVKLYDYNLFVISKDEKNLIKREEYISFYLLYIQNFPDSKTTQSLIEPIVKFYIDKKDLKRAESFLTNKIVKENDSLYFMAVGMVLNFFYESKDYQNFTRLLNQIKGNEKDDQLRKKYSDFLIKSNQLELDHLLAKKIFNLSPDEISRVEYLLNILKLKPEEKSAIEYNLLSRHIDLGHKEKSLFYFDKILNNKFVIEKDINTIVKKTFGVNLVPQIFFQHYTNKICKKKPSKYLNEVFTLYIENLLLSDKLLEDILFLISQYESCQFDLELLANFLITFPKIMTAEDKQKLKLTYCKSSLFSENFDHYLFDAKLWSINKEAFVQKNSEMTQLISEVNNCRVSKVYKMQTNKLIQDLIKLNEFRDINFENKQSLTLDEVLLEVQKYKEVDTQLKKAISVKKQELVINALNIYIDVIDRFLDFIHLQTIQSEDKKMIDGFKKQIISNGQQLRHKLEKKLIGILHNINRDDHFFKSPNMISKEKGEISFTL